MFRQIGLLLSDYNTSNQFQSLTDSAQTIARTAAASIVANLLIVGATVAVVATLVVALADQVRVISWMETNIQVSFIARMPSFSHRDEI